MIFTMSSHVGAEIRSSEARVADGPGAPTPGSTLSRPCLEPTFERLEELASLEPDWDGYEGKPPSSQAVAMAACLVAGAWDRFGTQREDRAQPYEIMPIADGGLQLEWRGSNKRLHLNVGPDGRISFLHVAGRAEDRTYREGDDLPRSEAFALVEQVIRS